LLALLLLLLQLRGRESSLSTRVRPRVGAAIEGVSPSRLVTSTIPSLEGRTFRTVGTDAEGEATAETVFEYHEEGGVVWARYSGGSVRLGYLVGLRTADEMDFRYSQLSATGETANGHCHTTISQLPDGRIRFMEDWTWESKPGSGINVTEESSQ
jgi:hypothetical protein